MHFSDLPPSEAQPLARPLPELQRAFGYSQEDLRVLLTPMARNGEEPIGSMGNDLALPVLSAVPLDTAGSVTYKCLVSLSITIESTVDISGASSVDEGSVYTLTLGTITSPGPGSGVGTSSSFITPGGPTVIVGAAPR